MSGTTQEAPRKRSTPRRTRPATTKGAFHPSHDDIAARARELYEAAGCPQGRDLEFWLEAERLLIEAHSR